VGVPATAKPRVLLMHDMEGLAGQDNPYSFFARHPTYPQAQSLLVADVNAAIEGLFAGGAGSVTVLDSHGSGSEPALDIPADRLDSRARMLPGQFDPYVDPAEEDRQYDAIALVGFHAKSGTRGFAAHTYTIGVQIFLEGHSVTEPELIGLLYGRFGIPVIFVSGDDRLREDLRTMPWIRYVTTKRATSASSAELYPVGEVHEAMRREARQAVQQLAAARVMKAREPLRVAVRAVPPANMRWLEGMPGLAYEDETVSFTAGDLMSAHRGMRPILNALNFSFSDAYLAPYQALPNADELGARGVVELFRRWFDAESGRLPVPTAPAP
jgi:D-amino peptidase